MSAEHINMEIISTDRLAKGIIVEFSDGTTTLFHAHFLFEVRHHDGNVDLTDEAEESPERNLKM